MSASRVGVIGLGAWGTALASHLQRAGHEVVAWSPEAAVVTEIAERNTNAGYLPETLLPEALRATGEVGEAAGSAEFVVWAIPTQILGREIDALAPEVDATALQIVVAKGFELETLRRPTEIVADALTGAPVSALLGPSHAEEVARGVPTSVSACAEDEDVATRVQMLFHTDTFRVYRNDDVVGAEVGAALKNVLAIAAGISDGLGFGDNTKGALLTRGLAEMSRLGIALGGNKETFFGLTGLGDLVTTCFSRHSRNRHVGERIGKGEPLATILSGMHQVAEGVTTAQAAVALAARHRIDVPIMSQVVAILDERKSPRDALLDLMLRDPKSE